MDAYCIHVITSKQLFVGLFLEVCISNVRGKQSGSVFWCKPEGLHLRLWAALLPAKPMSHFFKKCSFCVVVLCVALRNDSHIRFFYSPINLRESDQIGWSHLVAL